MNPVASLSTIEVLMIFVSQDESGYAQLLAHTGSTHSVEL